MNDVLDLIYKIGIVPVIAIDDIENAKPLAKALIDGGLPCAEVTFRTAAAKDAIKQMVEEYPDMLVGAGTVLTKQQVDDAIGAGAKFIVSPGFNQEIVEYCVSKNVPVVPGCATPSDVEKAIACGLEAVKFFPAEAAGGLAMIKAMSAPYGNMKFMPTGGINEKNLNDYLKFNKIIACGGSWMVKSELINNKQFDVITQMTADAVTKMLDYKIKHIGINCEDMDFANGVADQMSQILGFEKKVGRSSTFVGTGIEIMHSQYLGEKGHIAVGTTNVDRAVYHLSKRGVEFNWETAAYDGDRLKVIYMKGEVGGFAIHFVNN